MIPGGQAARTGQLRVGDRLLAVNGEDLTTASHQRVVEALLRPVDLVLLAVRCDPPPDGWEVSVAGRHARSDQLE